MCRLSLNGAQPKWGQANQNCGILEIQTLVSRISGSLISFRDLGKTFLIG